MAKKKLTKNEEFQIMKLVLDKFLWAGLFILLYGFYTVVRASSVQNGYWIMAGGAIILVLFMGIIVKEYEVLQ